MVRIRWVVPLAVLWLAACTSSEFRPESQAPDYPPYQGEVKLLEVFPPAGTYVRLGVVTVEAGGIAYGDTLTEKIAEVAAARGADAVVLQDKQRDRRDRSGRTTSVLAGWAIRTRAP